MPKSTDPRIGSYQTQRPLVGDGELASGIFLRMPPQVAPLTPRCQQCIECHPEAHAGISKRACLWHLAKHIADAIALLRLGPFPKTITGGKCTTYVCLANGCVASTYRSVKEVTLSPVSHSFLSCIMKLDAHFTTMHTFYRYFCHHHQNQPQACSFTCNSARYVRFGPLSGQ